jgi:hypothetical protein
MILMSILTLFRPFIATVWVKAAYGRQIIEGNLTKGCEIVGVETTLFNCFNDLTSFLFLNVT